MSPCGAFLSSDTTPESFIFAGIVFFTASTFNTPAMYAAGPFKNGFFFSVYVSSFTTAQSKPMFIMFAK